MRQGHGPIYLSPLSSLPLSHLSSHANPVYVFRFTHYSECALEFDSSVGNGKRQFSRTLCEERAINDVALVAALVAAMVSGRQRALGWGGSSVRRRRRASATTARVH
eukprot:scaffold65929_cov34-Tisochrysis_lutea.AAC.1